MHRRKRGGHADVALTLDKHQRSAVGCDQVRARDSGISGDELLPQDFAGETRQLLTCVERKIGLKLAFEQGSDTLARIVQGRSDDVRRLLIGHLQNELRQVALRYLDSDGFE